MLVCHCHGVSDRKIRELVRTGAGVREIQRRTGAGSNCAGCISAVREVVEIETVAVSVEAREEERVEVAAAG